MSQFMASLIKCAFDFCLEIHLLKKCPECKERTFFIEGLLIYLHYKITPLREPRGN